MEHGNDQHSKDRHDVEHEQYLPTIVNDCAQVNAALQTCNPFVVTHADITLSQHGSVATDQIFQSFSTQSASDTSPTTTGRSRGAQKHISNNNSSEKTQSGVMTNSGNTSRIGRKRIIAPASVHGIRGSTNGSRNKIWNGFNNSSKVELYNRST